MPPPDREGRIKESGAGYTNHVRENFLEAMEIPLLAGRTLRAQDDARGPKVVIVNQTFAKRYFPNENPVGKRFTFVSNKPDELEIVGLAKDAKYTSQRDQIPPTVYLPWRQELRSMNRATLELRTEGDLTAVVAAVRQAVRRVDENLPLNNVRTQIEQAEETLAMERLFARLLSLFGLLAQQLAAIGLFGVMAYSVSQRTQEIGIRMALGAGRADILRLLLHEGARMTAVGVAIGFPLALMLGRALSAAIVGVSPFDPVVLILAPLTLTAAATLATYVPARRATRVTPLEALRME